MNSFPRPLKLHFTFKMYSIKYFRSLAVFVLMFKLTLILYCQKYVSVWSSNLLQNLNFPIKNVAKDLECFGILYLYYFPSLEVAQTCYGMMRPAPLRHGVFWLKWRKSNVLHRACGMNWNTNFTSGLLIRLQCQTSCVLMAKWVNPHGHAPKSSESLVRRVKAAVAAKGEQIHINAHGFGMRCSVLHILLAIYCIFIHLTLYPDHLNYVEKSMSHVQQEIAYTFLEVCNIRQ